MAASNRSAGQSRATFSHERKRKWIKWLCGAINQNWLLMESLPVGTVLLFDIFMVLLFSTLLLCFLTSRHGMHSEGWFEVVQNKTSWKTWRRSLLRNGTAWAGQKRSTYLLIFSSPCLWFLSLKMSFRLLAFDFGHVPYQPNYEPFC